MRAEEAKLRDHHEEDRENGQQITKPQPPGEHWLEPSDWQALIKLEFAEVHNFLEDRKFTDSPSLYRDAAELALEACNFVLHQDILYRIDTSECKRPRMRLVVPQKYRQMLFKERHSGPYASHACGSKVLASLKRDFWWPRMWADVNRWAKACIRCAYDRSSRKNTPPLIPVVTQRPWELLCLDLLQLPQTIEGHRYALVGIDHFSKFGFAFPMFDMTAEATGRTLVERILLVFVPVERIHHDKGREFVNKIVQCLTDIFQIVKRPLQGTMLAAMGRVSV